MLSANAQMKVLNLCKGKTVSQALHRLEVMSAYKMQKQLDLRVKLVGLKIGE